MKGAKIMETYQIIPIKTGEFTQAEKSNFTYMIDQGTKLVAPILMYLIKGRDKLILVETGGSDEEWARKYHHPIRQKEEEKPLNALKLLGVNPEDIEIIVNTHLHWDHCFNNKLFPKAKIYVQIREMECAINPLPPQYVYYESYQIKMFPQWLNALDKIVSIDGDYVLCDGIELVTLPGHTPGLQGVLVNTDDGKYLIAGDAAPLFENWEGNAMHAHIPSGIHYSLPEYYETIKKMERICQHVLPGHDNKVFARKCYP
jgi:glyoxylase-like metal-dependent hydrolase (beta-lactamase superfamily II)